MHAKLLIATLLLAGGIVSCSNAPKTGTTKVVAPTRVRITTSKGAIDIELDSAKAPKSVANFLSYVRDGFYDSTVFHRVIPGFMVQGGGMTANLARKETRAPITNEATNGLKNLRGTLAMARTGEPHSATSQFFVNLVDNAFLDNTGTTPQTWGYCVFGKVVAGMDVVDKMAAVVTTRVGPHADVPKDPITILGASVIEAGK
jgi:cyclophilin family peptidyl-prolyl cis-trans isomerase